MAGALPEPLPDVEEPISEVTALVCDATGLCPVPCLEADVGLQAAARTCCGLSVASQPGAYTKWTDPFGPGVTGYNQNSVSIASSSFGAGAARIWKSNPGVGGDPNFPGMGTIFEVSFITCMAPTNQGVTGQLRVRADDGFTVYTNNGITGSCNPASLGGSNCLTVTRYYTVPLLPYPQVNTLRFHVWNQPNWSGATWATNPAWLEFRLDF